ncbi:uncharacterized protein LOC108914877 [Anoplophora glabripennis]|uniref:uncharacterized protein LOC108914877 n=1 Tax=Anoplophora glabripennis TaxID=217634 RepID=UPI0008735240|nr:uncharacterized protein LOC108914877 [Anoplophora glabripennis]
MAKAELAVCVLGIIACFCLHISDASLCKPNSKFKYDCNTCSCSSTGREFSCTNTICAPLIYKDKYLIEQNEKGYTILKPKIKNFNDEKKRNSDDDLFVNDQPVGEKFRRTVIKMSPYVKRPPGNLIEQSEDYVNYDGQISPSSEAEDTEEDYDDSNEDDSESDEDLVTYGKVVPKNRLY